MRVPLSQNCAGRTRQASMLLSALWRAARSWWDERMGGGSVGAEGCQPSAPPGTWQRPQEGEGAGKEELSHAGHSLIYMSLLGPQEQQSAQPRFGTSLVLKVMENPRVPKNYTMQHWIDGKFFSSSLAGWWIVLLYHSSFPQTWDSAADLWWMGTPWCFGQKVREFPQWQHRLTTE